MSSNKSGMRILVIGAGGLVGKTLVSRFTERGDICFGADISFETSIDGEGGQLRCDITSVESIQSCLKAIHEQSGRVDGVVNVAYPRNKNYGRHVFDVTFEDFCENVDLNLGGMFLVTQQVSKYFIDHSIKGSIVNFSSIYGVVAPRFEIYKGTPMTTPVEYAAAKSATVHLTKYFAAYLRDQGVRVNCVSPGGIEDGQAESFLKAYREQTLNKGMLNADDLVGGVRFLLSQESEFINGHNLVVDDGFSL